jgi:hypothetical protein
VRLRRPYAVVGVVNQGLPIVGIKRLSLSDYPGEDMCQPNHPGLQLQVPLLLKGAHIRLHPHAKNIRG